MRKIIYAINITADGCCDHTKGIADDELHLYHKQLMENVDTLLFGRKTYELMVPYWPDVAKTHSETQSVNEFADAFASKQLVVFSKTLRKEDVGNARIMSGDLQEEILKLKQEQGSNILLGGVTLPSKLIELGLVDEFHFVVQPVIAGEGKRLMEGINLPKQFQLQLLDTKILKSGTVAHHYSK